MTFRVDISPYMFLPDIPPPGQFPLLLHGLGHLPLPPPPSANLHPLDPNRPTTRGPDPNPNRSTGENYLKTDTNRYQFCTR